MGVAGKLFLGLPVWLDLGDARLEKKKGESAGDGAPVEHEPLYVVRDSKPDHPLAL